MNDIFQNWVWNEAIERKMSHIKLNEKCDRIARVPRNSWWQNVWASRSENSNCDQNIGVVWARIKNWKWIRLHTHHTPALTHISFLSNSKRRSSLEREPLCMGIFKKQRERERESKREWDISLIFLNMLYPIVFNTYSFYTCTSSCIGFVISCLETHSFSIVLCEK